jgi:hypothetical protein
MIFPMETSGLWPQSWWGGLPNAPGLNVPRFAPFDASGLMQQSVFASPLMLSPLAAAATATAPNIELQALNGFLHDVSACSIRKLYDYLDKNNERYTALSNCVPIVQQAVESYRTRDYARAFSVAYDAYRYITALKTTVPDLPNLYD